MCFAPEIKRLPLLAIGLGLAAAGLLAAAPGGAAAAPAGARMFVQSADNGELRGSLLTLRGRGIGRRVTWVQKNGRSGVVSVAKMHRRLFGRGQRSPNGVLHIDGRELTLRLSRPRISASRHRVRYRVRRLAELRRAAPASQRPVPRQFGAASLSLVGGPRVGQWGGQQCTTGVLNQTGSDLRVLSASKWDTDDWTYEPDVGTVFGVGGVIYSQSQGGFMRGCGNTFVVQQVASPSVTFTLTTTYPWWSTGGQNTTCTASDAGSGLGCVPVFPPNLWTAEPVG